MNKKLKSKWIKNLRSGKFKQGQWQLRSYNFSENQPAHCCLGVLCETAGLKYNGYNYVEGPIRLQSTLGKKMQKKFGLTEKQEIALIKMNDEQLKSFKQIANWIQKNL